MVICSVCGKVNPQTRSNCDQCGAHLAGAEPGPALGPGVPFAPVASPVPAATSPEGSGPVCHVCRRVNRSTSVFCASCGTRLRSPDGQAGAPAPSANAYVSAPASAHPTPTHPPTGLQIAPDVTGNIPANTLLKGRYRILRKIAQGGMGAVYESTDILAPTGSRWAVKEISPAALPASERAQAVSDFRREAQMLATLEHPNLPKVLETFEEMGKHFLVMEFIPGRTLLNVLDIHVGFIPEERVMAWARQVLDVLQYLHAQNPPIIYRDLKPSNVMLVEGTERIKLIDFGIARFHKAGKSHDTEAFGTAGYAPPEQYGKGQTDQRSDVYALAATLHHLLSKQDPSLNPFNWLPVRQFNPAVSQRVQNALQMALSLDPARRFQTIRDFADALGLEMPPLVRQEQAAAASGQSNNRKRAPDRRSAAPAQNGRGGATSAKAQPRHTPPAPIPAPQPAIIPPTLAVAAASMAAATVQEPGRGVINHAPTSAPIPGSVVDIPHSAPLPANMEPTTKVADGRAGDYSSYAPTSAMPTSVGHRDRTSATGTQKGSPKREAALVVSDRLVDLGEVTWNSKPPLRRVSLRGVGNGPVKGTVLASHPWIAYNPRQFQGNTVTLEVKVRKGQLPFGREELQVPNLFAIIWARLRKVLPLIGFWFWVVFLAASSLGRNLWLGVAVLVAVLLLSEALLWLMRLHVRVFVPARRLNTGRLVVKSSGGDEYIEVRAVAQPSLLRRTFGWAMAVLLLMLELLAVGWVVTALLPLALPGL